MIVNVLMSLALALLIHESAHYLTARLCGHKLTFRRQGLRLIWDMPDDTPARQKLIALSGFGAEILAVPIFIYLGLWAYPWVAIVHLAVYKWYAKGEYNDFKWLHLS